jgi:hypothetical protein
MFAKVFDEDNLNDGSTVGILAKQIIQTLINLPVPRLIASKICTRKHLFIEISSPITFLLGRHLKIRMLYMYEICAFVPALPPIIGWMFSSYVFMTDIAFVFIIWTLFRWSTWGWARDIAIPTLTDISRLSPIGRCRAHQDLQVSMPIREESRFNLTRRHMNDLKFFLGATRWPRVSWLHADVFSTWLAALARHPGREQTW